ncbi:NAD(P)-binding protein [Testicularia cyperi]|uniref:NAD(P)-binding protein n=1 Tax=Testicularia cyperi TaxID=1882483 RepID=A0A317XGH7_9BASI|nr:NAD(P)-binding protein [Testicularia cyperi]
MSANTASSGGKPVVLLTGASRGLGLGILKLLLSGSGSLSTGSASFQAASVVTVSRTLSDELKALQTQHPDDLVCVQGDVADPNVNQHAVQTATHKWGRLNSVVLNAGIVTTDKIADLTPEAFSEILSVNTVSLVTTVRAALPALRASGGSVVFVSSGAAVGNTAGWTAYNASKAAMNAIARTLANEEPELAVFSVRPGVIDTDMQTFLRSDGHLRMKESEVQRFLTMHKEGKLLQPHQPGFSIAALALKGTRDSPKDKDGNGLGSQGAFFNWDAPELADGFKL